MNKSRNALIFLSRRWVRIFERKTPKFKEYSVELSREEMYARVYNKSISRTNRYVTDKETWKFLKLFKKDWILYKTDGGKNYE